MRQQEKTKELENQVDCLEKEKEAREKEANEVWELPADDQAYGERITEEVNIHGQDVDNSEDLELRSENSHEGEAKEKERHLEG
ncbi:unnamed protein product [Heligmosomoides polygyrus]|uniref:Golgin subfamily A member 6-like protein 22 n=1 Tax=Heligmosomoides polygyrus TaxID=6339 RepID=A0A183G2Q8_HELPZ|nr:unnamed protein product [Heligmosomoides polygyrus]